MGRMKLPIPADLDPSLDKCIQITMPSDPDWLAMFWGNFENLTRWYTYQPDDAHSGKDIAAIWWEIYQSALFGVDCNANIIGDDMQFRQNGCLLEYSIDCEHWLTLYDPTDCIKEQTGQGGPGGPLIVGECKEYVVTLAANNVYKLPNPVNDGFSVEISDATGGWYDGGSGVWACPDGSNYILGTCVGSQGHVMGDPDATALHMELIAVIDGVTYPAYNTVITVPPGTGPADVYLQANDDDISNNAGGITFKVKVCGSAPVPCDPITYLWYDSTTPTIGDWTVASESIFSPASILADGAAHYVFALVGLVVPGTGYTSTHHPIGGTLMFDDLCHVTNVRLWGRLASGSFSDVRTYFHEGGIWNPAMPNNYHAVTNGSFASYDIGADNIIDGITLICYGDATFELGGVEITFS